RSLGALLYALVLVPLMHWAKPRAQLRVAVALAVIALSYPVLRTWDLVPTTFMLDTAASVDSARADSLKVRFDNEDRLLERASERFLFGWGRYGRSRVRDEAGRDISLTDGEWIIRIGTFGFLGFVAEFGLLALPIFRAVSALRSAKISHDAYFVAALA